MEATHVTAAIRNPAAPHRSWEGLFLVDTGATDCLVPRPHLEAHALVEHAAIPKTSLEDALHVAVAVVNRCTYLMTWNYRHLAGAGARARIEALCRDKGYEPAIICTPEELLEDEP